MAFSINQSINQSNNLGTLRIPYGYRQGSDLVHLINCKMTIDVKMSSRFLHHYPPNPQIAKHDLKTHCGQYRSRSDCLDRAF